MSRTIESSVSLYGRSLCVIFSLINRYCLYHNNNMDKDRKEWRLFRKAKEWPDKWTFERVCDELEYFSQIVEHGRMEKGKQVIVVFKKELAFGRGYSWQKFVEITSNRKDKTEKDVISDCMKNIENTIESRLFKWWLGKKYDTGMVKRYMATNTDMKESKEIVIKDKRVFNKDQLGRISKLINKAMVWEEEDDE